MWFRNELSSLAEVSLYFGSYINILGTRGVKHTHTQIGSIAQKSVATATKVCEPLALLTAFVHSTALTPRVNTWRWHVVKNRAATRRARWLRCNATDCLSNYANCRLFLAERSPSHSPCFCAVLAASSCVQRKCYAKNANFSTLFRERPPRTTNELDGTVLIIESSIK